MKKHPISHLIVLLFLLIAYPHVADARKVGRVAFAGEHEGGLWIADADTGKTEALDVGMVNIHEPAYSRKRRLLAFGGSHGHELPISLYIYDFNSRKMERIYKPSSDDDMLYRPEFTPSGDYLFALNYHLGIRRYSLANKTWEKVRVTGTKETNLQGISISKSGRKAALSAKKFKGFLLGDLNGTEIRIDKRILTDFDYCISPRWIGDDTIVFVGIRKKDDYQRLWRLSLATGALKHLTREPLKARGFMDISEDGKTIVFTATDARSVWRLWKIKTDGTGLEPLTKTGMGHLSPVWID